MAVRENRRRNELREPEIIIKPEKKQEKKQNSTTRFRLPSFENHPIVKILGSFFLLISLYLLVAFSSYLLTWSEDQDVVLKMTWQKVFDPASNQVENWMGLFGAMLAHQFIYMSFGVASFLFVILFFVLGYRLLFQVSVLPIVKTIAYTLFGLVFLSVLCGYANAFFTDAPHFVEGVFGYQINAWLNAALGIPGTAGLLVFLGLTAIIIAFNPSFKRTPKPQPEENTTLPEPENVELVKEEISKPIVFDKEIEKVETPEIETETTFIPRTPLVIEENDTDALADELVKKQGVYDSTLDLGDYKYPHIDLLEKYGNNKTVVDREELENNKNKIEETLLNYDIKIDKIMATVGPTVTLYEIVPAPGIRISKIKNLEDDIALSLAALGIRIIAPIPGKGTIGIEVPNQHPEIVSMRSLLASEKFNNTSMDLPIALGKTISNEVFIADLTKMPHLLMAGATGQGKSVGINALLVSLLFKKHPSQLKFVLIDPKKVELTLFKKIERHFLAKLPGDGDAIITDTKKVIYTLNSLCIEMDQRYDLLKEAQVRNLKEYNQKFISRKLNPMDGHRFLPYIVLVIDEFADLMMTAGKEIETPIARLAQLARAVGIHLVIATQRPSVNVITGTIKANFPARLAFRVTSKIDSRTILDLGGADQLVGRGDMLLSTGSDIIRLQCAFVDTPEVEKITEYIGSQRGYPTAHMLPEYEDENEAAMKEIDFDDHDAFFEEAARLVVRHQQGSTSLIQRKLKLGYNRAGRIIDQLEATGIVGPFEGSKAREVRYQDEYSLEQYLNSLNDKEK